MSALTTAPPSAIWVTPRQAAAHLEVSLSTLRRWMRDTSIPFSRIGRVVRFDVNALDRWTLKRSA